jgi:2-methylcitrate dehydratase PrpD
MLIKELGRFVAETRYDDLPQETINFAKSRILDLITAAAVGFQTGAYRPVSEILRGNGGEATVWGEVESRPLRDAVLLNCFMSHSTYFEDGSRFTGGHPSSVVIPAALTLGETRNSSGKDIILSVVLGYDIFIRLGRAIYPSTVARGFQSTAVLGALGAAAASAVPLKLDAERCKNALAIASNLGVGLKDALKAPASQPIQVGRSCEGGVLAALLAQIGLPGSDTILEHGFLKGFADDSDSARILEGLGGRYLIGKTYVKIHGGCRGNHAPIDVVLNLMKTHDIMPDTISRVEIGIDTVTLAASIAEPKDGKQAQLSVPFAVAVTILEGNASIYQYTDEKVNDPEVRKMMSKLRIQTDPALNEDYPERRGAHARIILQNGREFKSSIEIARGEPELPLTYEEIEKKFFFYVKGVLRKRAKRVCEIVRELDSLGSISHLIEQFKAW